MHGLTAHKKACTLIACAALISASCNGDDGSLGSTTFSPTLSASSTEPEPSAVPIVTTTDIPPTTVPIPVGDGLWVVLETTPGRFAIGTVQLESPEGPPVVEPIESTDGLAGFRAVPISGPDGPYIRHVRDIDVCKPSELVVDGDNSEFPSGLPRQSDGVAAENGTVYLLSVECPEDQHFRWSVRSYGGAQPDALVLEGTMSAAPIDMRAWSINGQVVAALQTVGEPAGWALFTGNADDVASIGPSCSSPTTTFPPVRQGDTIVWPVACDNVLELQSFNAAGSFVGRVETDIQVNEGIDSLALDSLLIIVTLNSQLVGGVAHIIDPATGSLIGTVDGNVRSIAAAREGLSLT